MKRLLVVLCLGALSIAGVAFATDIVSLTQILAPFEVHNSDGNLNTVTRIGVVNNAPAVLQWQVQNATDSWAVQYFAQDDGWLFILDGYGGWAPLELTGRSASIGPGQVFFRNGLYLDAQDGPLHVSTGTAKPTVACHEGDQQLNDAPSHVPVAGWICVLGVWHGFGAILP